MLAALLALWGLAASAQTAWVSSEKDNALTLVDLKTLSVAGVVPTCKRPRHMQVAPDGKRLFVACAESGQADVIDIASRKTVGRVSLGDDPEAFDFSKDGKALYVSAEDEGALVTIDAASGKTLASVPVGKEPEGVRTSPDGKLVFVTSEVANMVHAVDTATGKLVKNIAVGKRPRRMVFTPDGSQLWVTNELGASISVISVKDLAVVQTIPLELKGVRAEDITPVGLAMTRDGKTAFVGMGRANHVGVIDVASRKLARTVLVGKRAWHVALSPDESRLVATNGLSDDVTIVETATGKALKSVPVGRVPYMAVVLN
ncbi:PQQ-dependent catabolism-associated beta-propeller protein [Azohydromonas caseinilytica]|uniref:PQQ-dependent catabolism-associated beta-propeller protein n=1 Tax=Azohydromonas caseinilytica TaxID=2728836 RepID=A0A848F552_9BURK|nr:PQQ-dependent catabolism-associated beta-propeller protein [Azohydromonas caseinilytica]